MPRLRNVATGTVVNVSKETAQKLSGYEPVDEKKSESKTSSSSSSSKTSK